MAQWRGNSRCNDWLRRVESSAGSQQIQRLGTFRQISERQDCTTGSWRRGGVPQYPDQGIVMSSRRQVFIKTKNACLNGTHFLLPHTVWLIYLPMWIIPIRQSNLWPIRAHQCQRRHL